MARKRASLEGRGHEVLEGIHPDETPAADAASAPPGAAGAGGVKDATPEAADAAEAPQEPTDGGEELPPEWADSLQEEALSASGQGVADSVAGTLDLPPLATALARPGNAGDQAVEEMPPGVDVLPDEEPVPPGEPVLGPAEAAEAASDEAHVLTEVEGEPETEDAITAPPSALAGVPEATGPSTPPAPMHNEVYASDAAGGASMPAPKEKPEATDAELRLKLGGLIYEAGTVKPSEEDLGPEGPKAAADVITEGKDDEAEQPSRPRSEEEVLEYLGDLRKALWDETFVLYQAVSEVLIGDAKQSRALELLREAQDILLEKPRQFDRAKYNVGWVQSWVSRRRNVNRWSNTYGWAIFVYEIACIVGLVTGILFVDRISGLAGAQAADFISGLWSTMMWGGLGGVLSAFYSLYWHVAQERDFDKQYSMWYVVQPVMGLLLGALVYLLIGAGFLTARASSDADGNLAASLFRFAVACVGGFRQKLIFELIDRAIQVITPRPQEPKPKENQEDADETPAAE